MAISRCEITYAGKARNGSERWWCRTHFCSATGKYGVRLEECGQAIRSDKSQETLRLDPGDFPGGIGIWGAVPPVLDSRPLSVGAASVEPPGVHVHARRAVDLDEKSIDRTVDELIIPYSLDLFDEGEVRIDRAMALSYLVSKHLELRMSSEICPNCSHVHLDQGAFATFEHQKHLCEKCGRYFRADFRSVSNPIIYIRRACPIFLPSPNRIRATESIEIDQREYRGGVQIWASNPSLLWTSSRAEQDGIHVHAYDAQGHRSIDETYHSVTVDGVSLDEGLVRLYMIQQVLPEVRQYVGSYDCQMCGAELDSRKSSAFVPAADIVCVACGCSQKPNGRTKVIANPIVKVLERLKVFPEA